MEIVLFIKEKLFKRIQLLTICLEYNSSEYQHLLPFLIYLNQHTIRVAHRE